VNIQRPNEAFRITYDYVFVPDESKSQVYDIAAKSIVGKILKGYNVAIFAYGQTGSGKTFSMGTADTESASITNLSQNSGIVQRAVSELFENMTEDGSLSFQINVSFLDVRCFNIFF
jgi:hypothetical protein